MGRAGLRLAQVRPSCPRPAAGHSSPSTAGAHACRVCASSHRLPPWCPCPASSLFDEPASRYLEMTEMVVEHAKRLVESHYDGVILLESITRLGRASSAVVPSRGKVLSGGAERLLSAPNASSRNTDPQIDLSCRARSQLRTVSGIPVLIWPRDYWGWQRWAAFPAAASAHLAAESTPRGVLPGLMAHAGRFAPLVGDARHPVPERRHACGSGPIRETAAASSVTRVHVD